MQIRDLSCQESTEILKRARLGRLACARNGRPYVTPAFLAFESNFLYGFSSVGRKITWMRENPFVCVEFDELVNPQNWVTVIIEGNYQELPKTPEFEAARGHAHELLQRRPVWWEPANVKTTLQGNARPIEPVYFRILIEKFSGHRGMPDASPEPPWGWMRKLLIAGKRNYS
jgi:nitroimidazol reductase NimA-like FMN-containing flavoprotein (pyridoxamine 5'-phosphate oxidase superfamily)